MGLERAACQEDTRGLFQCAWLLGNMSDSTTTYDKPRTLTLTLDKSRRRILLKGQQHTQLTGLKAFLVQEVEEDPKQPYSKDFFNLSSERLSPR